MKTDEQLIADLDYTMIKVAFAAAYSRLLRDELTRRGMPRQHQTEARPRRRNEDPERVEQELIDTAARYAARDEHAQRFADALIEEIGWLADVEPADRVEFLRVAVATARLCRASGDFRPISLLVDVWKNRARGATQRPSGPT